MIERDQLEEWFPDDDIIVVPESALPEGLTSESARDLLMHTGLPESFLDVVELDTAIVKRIRLVEEVYQSHDEVAPDGAGNLFYLGFAGQPFLCVDGSTGVVVQVHRNFGVRLLASSLEIFVCVLGFISREVQKYQQKSGTDEAKFATRLRNRTLKELRESDPDALPKAEHGWRELLDDIAATVS
jgi:hypothetical protein